MKIKSLLQQFAGTILGALLIFYGMSFFGFENAGLLAYGIITFIFGIFYLGCSVIRILKLDGAVAILKPILSAYEVCAFPWTYFVMTIVVMVNFGAENLSATDWIISLSLMISVVFLNALAIVATLMRRPLFVKVATIAVAAFFAIIVLTEVFSTFGGNGSIGSLSLYELFTLICYGSLAISFLTKPEEKAEQPAEEASAPEESWEAVEPEEPAEEPVGEPASEEPVEEPAEEPAPEETLEEPVE